ncbi:pyridine nucleotide-disulfide oxidoreductase [Candidatus Nezhaarchaeota archaeon WYZ-LMO8]|nr:MAG: pyridine nucleotide-disulfide oxidoreductase [Candidatus Nezhaarchaeota archaeon WYZ-LMO8]TDA37087.1 MAG: pyridine nucleotide-disulfide oxidoreductase [Candidatus Nezhaarchaeota archaeon WYZ-LMO7]
MKRVSYDVVILGGGPAGLAAATKLAKSGLKVLLIENRKHLGGIPVQCIHTGFGLLYFKRDVAGTEFAQELVDMFLSTEADYMVKAHVTEIREKSHGVYELFAITRSGVCRIESKGLIYAAGARERSIFEIWVTGERPEGVYTAGEAQALMDLYGIMPGRDVVIIGSGDVGLIMARRFAVEGANVKAVVEIMPYPGGLIRNVVWCLQDFNIPLLLSHMVRRIEGRSRVEKVVVCRVDEDLNPIPGSEFELKCDTVIVSAGLRPDVDLLAKLGVELEPTTGGPVVNDLLEASKPRLHVAGNALLINDLVDYAVEQGEWAAEGLLERLNEKEVYKAGIKVKVGEGLRFVVPHYISGLRDVTFYMRAQKPMNDVVLEVDEIGFQVELYKARPAEIIRIKIPVRALARSKEVGTITFNARST